MAGKRSAFSTFNTLEDPKRDASDQMVFAEFARRLQAKMQEKGWNQSELARQCAKHVPKPQKGQKQTLDFGRDLISRYVRGLSMPRPERIPILAKALGCPESDLIPPGGVPSARAAFNMRDAGGGRVHLTLNRTFTMEEAAAIVQIIQKADQP